MSNIGTAQQRILGILADQSHHSMSLWQLKAALWGKRRYYRHFACHSILQTKLKSGDAANLNRSLDGLCKRGLIDKRDWQRRRITLTPEGLRAHQARQAVRACPSMQCCHWRRRLVHCAGTACPGLKDCPAQAGTACSSGAATATCTGAGRTTVGSGAHALADWSPERGLLAGIAIQALQDAMAADTDALDYLAWWLDVDANRLAQAIRGHDKRYKRSLMTRLRQDQ